MLFPFIWLGAGLLFGFTKFSRPILKYVDNALNVSLIVLMFAIGAGIGCDEDLVKSVFLIGFRCVVIGISAIAGCVIFTVIAEKTVLPLEKMKEKLMTLDLNITDGSENEKGGSHIIWIIPLCIVLGILTGAFFLPSSAGVVLDIIFMVSLAALYMSVGISITQQKQVFAYIKLVGARILILPAVILLGCIAGGAAVAPFMDIPAYIPIVSAAGSSYYSVTGAHMTNAYGVEAGAYGFLVNVTREFLAVLFLPLLSKISKGSPIAAGAAASMDTLFVPVCKISGNELGAVAFISGTVLTVLIPFTLPLVSKILEYI